jgi:SAM-dependent MidA family methyltransferase
MMQFVHALLLANLHRVEEAQLVEMGHGHGLGHLMSSTLAKAA